VSVAIATAATNGDAARGNDRVLWGHGMKHPDGVAAAVTMPLKLGHVKCPRILSAVGQPLARALAAIDSVVQAKKRQAG